MRFYNVNKFSFSIKHWTATGVIGARLSPLGTGPRRLEKKKVIFHVREKRSRYSAGMEKSYIDCPPPARSPVPSPFLSIRPCKCTWVRRRAFGGRSLATGTGSGTPSHLRGNSSCTYLHFIMLSFLLPRSWLQLHLRVFQTVQRPEPSVSRLALVFLNRDAHFLFPEAPARIFPPFPPNRAGNKKWETHRSGALA